MMQRQDISNALRITLAAAAVVVVVVVVANIVDPEHSATDGYGTPVPQQSTSSAASAEDVAATAVEIFEPGTTEDIAQEITVDPTAAWPISGCAGTATTEAGRVAFVVGSEHGPEYAQARAIGWFASVDAAAAAYRALESRVRGCGSAGAEVVTAPAGLGAESTAMTVVSPGSAGVVDVTAYTIVRSADVVVLASDRSTFAVGAVPDPAASSTVAAAERLLGEVCRVDAARC